MLFLGLGAVAVFVAVIAPAVGRHPAVRPGVEVIRDSGIEAGAYFYTDVEKVQEAELFIRHAQEFSPGTDRP